jgi:ribosome biogenesis GTPase / thiamine phosphate phosphatase
MSLGAYGWTEARELGFGPQRERRWEPARVVCELRRKFYAVWTDSGESLAECGGGFFHEADGPADFPTVGDWVAIERRTGGGRVDIRAVLPRTSKFSRKAAGEAEREQLLAANLDTLFLVAGLDRNFNVARLQRFLVAAAEGGVRPVILLNKTDLKPDAPRVAEELAAEVNGVPVVLTSATTRRGLKHLQTTYLLPGRTVAFVGSSGVGKSSLVNVLLREEAMPTAEVREKDSKGRHTTTRRELVVCPGGALLIDTPGLRELQPWEAEAGLAEAFADIVALATRCRFGRCRHQTEPGCAVQAALATGALTPERLEAYRKLEAEQAARVVRPLRPGAVANKPGWRRQGEPGARGRRWSSADD